MILSVALRPYWPVGQPVVRLSASGYPMRSTAKTLAAFSDPAIFVFHCVYTDRPSPPAEYLTVNLDRSKFSSFPFLVSRARKSLFTYTCSSNFLYKRNRNISHFRRIPLLSLDRRNVLYRGYSIIAVMASVPWTLSRAHVCGTLSPRSEFSSTSMKEKASLASSVCDSTFPPCSI